MRVIDRLSGIAVVSFLLGSPGGAQAQRLDEIIVTAERRELSLQDTPISIAAFNAETMELKGIENLEDVADFTPNLDMKGSRFNGNIVPSGRSAACRAVAARPASVPRACTSTAFSCRGPPGRFST